MAHLFFVVLLPIIAGAHASLTRPTNVLPKSKSKSKNSEDPDDDDDDIPDSTVETLSARDALWFPITAGITLSGLYFLIKNLDDPAILTRLLTYYFMFVGTFSVARGFSDALALAVGFYFPRRWTVEGADGKGYTYIAGHDRYKLSLPEKSNTVVGWAAEVAHPFPKASIPVPVALYKPLWALRRFLLAKWVFVIKFRGTPSTHTFWLGDFLGLLFGVINTIIYTTSGKHWIASNLMGISLSYTALQILSPSSFAVGSLLLGLLFFYDIYFVFFTPIMVTVATKLDVPIKLILPRAARAGQPPAFGMIGLGDIVLPGMMMALALRFDFWRACEAQRVAAGGALQKYIRPTGTWGERWWNPRSLVNEKTAANGPQVIGGRFSKPYFYSSVAGYVAGMVATFTVMYLWEHAQPALLYLVPAVVGSVWGCAAVRGEVGVAWGYSEEREDEEKKEEEKKDSKTEDEKKKEDEKEDKSDEKKTDEKTEDDDKKSTGKSSLITTEEQKTETDIAQAISEGLTSPAEITATSSEAQTSPMEASTVVAPGEDEDGIEMVNEAGENEYISIKVVKKLAPGADS